MVLKDEKEFKNGTDKLHQKLQLVQVFSVFTGGRSGQFVLERKVMTNFVELASFVLNENFKS